MPLRKHQQDFNDVMDDCINGADFNTVLLRATPGAGKSTIPAQAAKKLIPAGIAERLCWIVPRDALRSQGEGNFLDPYFRKMFDHRFSIRAATNEVRPCRGTHGFVTTYQAIGFDNRIAINEFKKHRYILVLDEFHHCELNGKWAENIQPLVDMAAFIVLMTGTLERGDGKAIAFIPYQQKRNDGYKEYLPDLSAPGIRYIEYTRAQALRDKAIIPMQFYFHDGSAEFERDGRRTRIESISNAMPEDIGAALYTAMRTDYAKELLAVAVESWMKWKKKIRTAKLLVVCADFETAKESLTHLRKIVSHRPADIATSHDAGAQLKIKKFKNGKLDILVTIAMAYEGLSVEQITHIACLTHIRSTPWIEQMVARAVRIDKAYRYRGQVAHIFAPDDPLFRKIVAKIESEQLAVLENYNPGRIKDEDRQLTLFDDGLNELAAENPRVVPIDGKITGMREWMYGCPEPNECFCDSPEQITPKEKETNIRKEIEGHVRQYCFQNRIKQQRINAEIKTHFGKSRSVMNSAELSTVLSFVRNNYPTSYQVRGCRMPVDRRVDVFNG